MENLLYTGVQNAPRREFVGEGGTIRIDQDLTDVSFDLSQADGGFIAQQALPMLMLTAQTDYLPDHGKSKIRVNDDTYADKATPNEAYNNYGRIAVGTNPYSLMTTLTQRQLDNVKSASVWDLEADATELVTENMLLNLEIRAAALLFGTGNYDVSYTEAIGSSDEWDKTTSFPIKYLQAKWRSLLRMQVAKQMKLFTLALGQAAWEELRNHGTITAKYANLSMANPLLTEQQVADAIGVKRILVGQAIQSLTKFQLADADYSPTEVWTTDSAALYYAPEGTIGKRQIAKAALTHWDRWNSGKLINIYKETGMFGTYHVVGDADYKAQNLMTKGGFLTTAVNG